MTQKKTKLGVLALMLEDYLPLFPGIDRAQTAYVNEVLDGLRDAAEFVFPHAAMNRAQIESLVAQYNHEKLDGILILLLTYSQGAYAPRQEYAPRTPSNEGFNSAKAQAGSFQTIDDDDGQLPF